MTKILTLKDSHLTKVKPKIFQIKRSMKNKLSTLLLAGVATLTMFSCVDNDNLNENNGDNDALVSFGVNDVQTRAIAVSGGSSCTTEIGC